MVTTFSIEEANSELENMPILFPKIFNRNKNVKITVYSIWDKQEIRLKNLSIIEVLARDLILFRKAYKKDHDNEGLKDQIIRIESILVDMHVLPGDRTTFNIIFDKKEYPIHIIIKHHTLIFT